MNEDYGFTYFTIHYACGHLAARPVRRAAEPDPLDLEDEKDEHTRYSYLQCPVCRQMSLRRLERRMERAKGMAS